MENNVPLETWRVEGPPRDEAEVRVRHESNRAGWNEGAVRYSEEIDAAIVFLRDKGSNLHPIERRRLGSLRDWCKFAIHLQCASGRDTLSLWNEGVQRVAGVDISDVHIANARKISAAVNALAEWYRCDVLDTPHELDGTADLVYTGRGALCWLQDINAYAQVVSRLLKPGGVYHVFDDHPILALFHMDSVDYLYSGLSYFGHYESNLGWPATYIGDLEIPIAEQARKYEKVWTLMEIHNALTNAGLVVEYLGEHPDPYWDVMPNLSPNLRGKIPLTFSILARKPHIPIPHNDYAQTG